MPNQVIEVRVVKQGLGVSVQGVTRSDRGTKYILRSEYVSYKGLDKEQRKEVLQEVAKRIFDGS